MQPFLTNDRLTRTVTVLSIALFIPLFVTRGLGKFDFWWWMSANVVGLSAIAVLLDRGWREDVSRDLAEAVWKKAGLGLASATALYAVFYLGNTTARHLLPFAGRGIENVYAFKDNVSAVRIALLMAFVIGPGEELFWRGFLQRRLQMEKGPLRGFLLATTVYTAVHLASGNLMLVLAAGVCGLFWGFLYLRTGSLLVNVISHTIWDLVIFLIFPMN
ncbi:MAG: CPBP family intramembrane metalloprotease [Deltaproteobacteria bacterium]|nr:CPBP family intramembrane metalloprotease [Deltaproteobacteria bacterium]